MNKIRSIVIDSGTCLLDEEYMTDKRKPTHDKWKDWAQVLWGFNNKLMEFGFESLLVIGPPGSGKSCGIRTLPSKSNIWFNADNKNPTWVGGRKEYGKKSAPIAPYHIVPKSYNEITEALKEGLERDMFEEERFAIITGHTENYNSGPNYRERLQVIGALSNKMFIEKKFESVFYSKVKMVEGKPTYLLETQNNGYNTARSFMGAFEPEIENDYNFVINTLLENY